jgi:hypothetical protein
MVRMPPITMEETMAAATVDPMEVGIERPGRKCPGLGFAGRYPKAKRFRFIRRPRVQSSMEAI